MVVVYCPEDLEASVRAMLGRSVLVETDWLDVQQSLRLAVGLIVIQRFLSNSMIQRLQVVRRDTPLTRLAVVCHAGARNMDSLATAGIHYNRFLAIEQIETHFLPGVVQQFTTTDLRTMLKEALQSCCQSEQSRLVVQLVFEAGTFPQRVTGLAAAVGCTEDLLRRRLKHELGLLPIRLLQWNVLIRALELVAQAVRPSEFSELLRIDETTLKRDAHDLLGLTFGKAAAEGARAAGTKLLQVVAQHAKRIR
jgi:hypothetical protein